MLLSELKTEAVRLIGDGSVRIDGLAADSREVKAGDLFAAVPGVKADGAGFIAAARAAGAVAVLRQAPANDTDDLPILEAANVRLALAQIAARFYGRQPATMVAVTGTNGKSSIASFVRQIGQSLGIAAASIGTLGVQAPGIDETLGLTTPGPIAIHRILQRLADDGVTLAAMEASSHALDQYRLDGVRLRAAAFTNLTRDHFDYHGDFEAYFTAKARLFRDLLPRTGVAVLNADIPEFEPLSAIARARGLEVMDFGHKAGALKLVHQAPTAHGQLLSFTALGRTVTIESSLVGGFQAHNLLAAVGLMLAAGIELDRIQAVLPAVKGAHGRVERVAARAHGAPVFVDYAHTSDALERVLEALRLHTRGRLFVVFGAGGDRDPGKRALMGAAAARLADRVYVTDDNPRSEDPAAIRQAVLAGCPGGIDAGDRRQAIFQAVADLGPDDLLVIAGKGHERGQTIAGTVYPFDDEMVAREAVAMADGVPA
ncbi:UDP-N-acetylmuramoylalanyl-D-glutamate--2,6-diaminopimelate ligase [Arboricoccus pini]|uniref:UDP-N-acetylmuramoyl-L-alanyl-D-glutamate--2,6-diaminopimelate ligase n=1 Tax=Arboricoccus pini TaxID=1963835 RepID=A0A212QA05_9PROT|nr:UDP-N-acetylmuramoyl-L-alanyl-D-glutamate--2,6-diaminopimelate ligase [Arboricoccus pini]SNB56201.1 UDP-N-acetylmuramoylalanyl-D-glutamate--2,6-diaminopimelate ligase [Arboricoccus pini]